MLDFKEISYKRYKKLWASLLKLLKGSSIQNIENIAHQGIRYLFFSENFLCILNRWSLIWKKKLYNEKIRSNPIASLSGYVVNRLVLKNCSFALTRPTQLWRCRLKIFYWTSKAKKFFELKTCSKVVDYFNVNFYFSNARLYSVEHIYYFPQ